MKNHVVIMQVCLLICGVMSVYSGVAANYIGIFKNYKCVMHKVWFVN